MTMTVTIIQTQTFLTLDPLGRSKLSMLGAVWVLRTSINLEQILTIILHPNIRCTTRRNITTAINIQETRCQVAALTEAV